MKAIDVLVLAHDDKRGDAAIFIFIVFKRGIYHLLCFAHQHHKKPSLNVDAFDFENFKDLDLEADSKPIVDDLMHNVVDL